VLETPPNQGLELTAYSVRSYVAPASGSSSGLALGMRKAVEPSFLHIVVAKRDVLAGDMRSTADVLKSLNRSPAYALPWRARVDIAFDGDSDTPWALCEIPEVRNFLYQLDAPFPCWLFLLSKAHCGLPCIML
jgi:hypothetical protein